MSDVNHEVAVRVRRRLLEGLPTPRIAVHEYRISPICAHEVAKLSADESYTGFEDPRSAAIEFARQQNYIVECGRVGCMGKYGIRWDGGGYTEISPCSDIYSCLKETWDLVMAVEPSDPRYKDSLRPLDNFSCVPSNSQIGWLCLSLACGYSAGSSFSGPGEAGSCTKREAGDIATTDSATSNG